MAPSERTDFDQRTKTAIMKTIQEQMGPDNLSTNTMRVAGAHYINPISTVKASLEGYISTGVVAGNKLDRDLLGNNGKGHANPTFVFSSATNDGYTAHWGCNALDGFHLAEVFDEDKTTARAIEDAARVAQSQFRGWCQAFIKAVHKNRLKIIWHCGDAIRLCYELQEDARESWHRRTGLPMFLGPWTLASLSVDDLRISLDRVSFDVIETSNLADHLGLLTVLPATIPLLIHTASSVLYTEPLIVPSKRFIGLLEPHLCLETSLFSILVGLTPCDLLLGEWHLSFGAPPLNHQPQIATRFDCCTCFICIVESSSANSDFYVGDMAYSKITEQMISETRHSHYRISTAWKYPQTGDATNGASNNDDSNATTASRVHVGPEDLGDLFVQLYAALFAYHDVNTRSRISVMNQHFAPLILREQFSPPNSHSTIHGRAGFIAILRTAMQNIHTDWQACLQRIISAILELEDQELLDCGTQELLLYIYATGLLTNADLAPHHTQEAAHPNVKLHSIPVASMSSLPQSPLLILNLVLMLPRKTLQGFMNDSYKHGNSDVKICVTHKPSRERHTFGSLQTFFGSMRRNAADPSAYDVVEDLLGWSGSSDLIVTCPVLSSSLFLASADEVSVSLSINNYTSPGSFQSPRRVVYECAISNTERVLLLNAAPMSGGCTNPSVSLPVTSSAEATCVSACISKGRIVSLCYRDQLPTGSKQSKAPAENGDIIVRQSSPCSMTLKTRKTDPRVFVYPFPVDGSQAKTTLNEVKSCLEVTVPLSSAERHGGYDLKPFPIHLVQSSPELWDTPRISVQQQPVVRLQGNVEWLTLHLASAFTKEEQAALEHRRETPTRRKDGMMDFKQSLQLVINCFAGSTDLTNWQAYKGFCLYIKDTCEFMFYGNALRHDPKTASVFLDGWVIQKDFAVTNLPNKDFLPVKVSEHECPIWRQFMPSVFERCRIGWTHGETCEYRQTGRIPLSLAKGSSPICSCGQGRQVDDFPTHPSMARLARRATRIALHPVFAVRLKSFHQSSPSQLSNLSLGPASSTARAPAQAPSKPKCDNCGKERDGLKPCPRCGNAHYCNSACRNEAWKEHKKVCGK